MAAAFTLSTSPRQLLAKLLQGLAYLAVAALVFAVLMLMQLLYRELDRPFNELVINGEFSYLERANLTELVNDNVNQGFISIDLNELKSVLLTHPWIAGVSLTRRWPSSLLVDVVEEVPIARWGDSGFLNRLGEPLLIPDNSALGRLPVLRNENKGDSTEQAAAMMRNYQLIAGLLAGVGLKVIELQRDALGSWRVTTEPQLKLMLGREQLADKIDRFKSVWISGLQNKQRLISQIDLRYSNGLAVQWLAVDSADKKEITRG